MGIDVSASLLQEGRETSTSLRLVRGDIEALPFRDRSLDVVLCECVLSLMRDPGRVLAEGYRVLLPSGRLVLTDLYLRDEGHFRAGPRRPGASCVEGAMARGHIEALLHAFGFEIFSWEDHTAFLKHLAAQLVLEFGSLGALLGEGAGWQGGCKRIGRSRWAGVGYFLLGARKTAS